MNTTRHIGLFGGTFNPVHNGHLLAAESVSSQLQLDELRFLPAAQSPFKNRPQIEDRHRLAMLELAIADYPGFFIDPRELNAPTPSYTVNTLKAFRREFPCEVLYLLLGMDAWREFEHWHQWREILGLCHLVVMTRPGYSPHKLSELWQDHRAESISTLRKERAGRLYFISVPPHDAASNRTRQRIRSGQDTGEDLPATVAKYIEIHRLYR